MTADGRPVHAFGKIILFGEHAVVWGTRALAAALPCGMSAEVRAHTEFTVAVPAWDFSIRSSDATVHGEAFRALLSMLPQHATPLALTIHASIPPRAGLGSSAALAAVVVNAVAAFHDGEMTFDTRFRAVQAWESIFHGNPSGLDAAVALSGGAMLYSKREGIIPIRAVLPRLMVVHSGAPGDTKITVARFADEMARTPSSGQKRLTRIAKIVDLGKAALEAGDGNTLGALMLENHEILAGFGVSTPALDRIVDTAVSAGALGAKLTGGGGGGCALVLAGEDTTVIREEMTAAGYRVVFP